MMELIRVGKEAVSGRELFVVEAARPDDVPPVLPLPSRYFACLLAGDATTASDAELAELARRLLSAGCVYVCCWGPDCERVHDLFDVADLEFRPDGPYAMSTWHRQEPLSETLWFLLFNTCPDDAYFDECQSVVGITIGSPVWAAEIRAALSDPGEFCTRVLTSDEESAKSTAASEGVTAC